MAAQAPLRPLQHGGEMSAAMTWPDGPTAASAASATMPVPVAMSSTRMPGASRATRSRAGTKSRETRPNTWSYAPAAAS